MDDAGVYQVTAANEHGISVYQAEVTVDRKNIFLIIDLSKKNYLFK